MSGLDVEPEEDLPDEIDPVHARIASETYGMGIQRLVAQGGNPLTQNPPVGPGPFPTEVVMGYRMMLEKQAYQQKQAVLDSPELGLREVETFFSGVMDRYRAHNKEELLKQPKTPEDQVKQIEQLKPVVVDPNLVADMRQRLVKIDQALKQIDPRDSVYRNPRTRALAMWVGREAGETGAGYLVSGGPKLKEGAFAGARVMAQEAVEGLVDFPLNILHGVNEMAREAVTALGGPDIGPLVPQTYIEGPDGTLHMNAAKVPSLMDAQAMAWAYATDQNVQQYAAQQARTRELEMASREGFEVLLKGGARIAGAGLSFGKIAGPVMAAGGAMFRQLIPRGLQQIGVLRGGERTLKMVRAMANGVGAGLANGMLEASAYGTQEGYAKAFLHGMVMAPIMLAFGAGRRGLEWQLVHRANMPGKLAKIIGGAMEGVGFGAIEAHAPELLPGAWGFMKNPNEETWQTYAKNIAGFLMMHFAARGASPSGELFDMMSQAARDQQRRSHARAAFAERLEAGGATPGEISKLEPYVNMDTLRALGRASRQSREGQTFEERGSAREDYEILSQHLDTQEMGRGPSEESVTKATQEAVHNVPRETPEGEEPTQADISRGRQDPITGRWRSRPSKGAPHGPGGERAGPQSLQVPPTRQVPGTPGVQPVRASDIFLEMMGRPERRGFRIPGTQIRLGGREGDPVSVAIRGGRIRTRELGHFQFYQNLMRTDEARDLVVGAHEWAHAMHRHMTVGRGGREFPRGARRQIASLLAGPDGPAIAYEMGEILRDYPGANRLPMATRWMETWAEWHARNLLGEVGLDRLFPAVSTYMRRWLASPSAAVLRPQYERIQSMLHRYNIQGAEERVRQSIVRDTDPETESERAQRPGPYRRAVDFLTHTMFNDMVYIKRSMERWVGAAGRSMEDIPMSHDPVRVHDALAMTADKTNEEFVMRGIRVPVPEGQAGPEEHVPGLREVLEPMRPISEDFYKYIVAVRNLALYERGKHIQLPPQDYAATIQAIVQRHPQVETAAAGLKRWTDALVDYVARSGNLDPEAATRIKDAYALYVPFFRAIEGPAQQGQGRGVAERGTGLARIKGSTYEVRDPLVALQEVSRSLIAKAHQNQVMTALYKLSQGHEAGALANIVSKDVVPTTHPIRRILDHLEGALPPEVGPFIEALRQANALNPSTITTFAERVIPTGKRAIVAFTPRLSDAEIAELVQHGAHGPSLRAQNGELQWMELDTKVYEALMGMDKMPHLPQKWQTALKFFQIHRDVVRFFATGVNPGFTVANALRDMITAPMFGADGRFRPLGGFRDFIHGAVLYHSRGRMRELYNELGVSTSSFYDEGMRRAVTGQNAGFRATFAQWRSSVENFMSAPENYLRITRFEETYNRARQAGRSEMDARLEALESGKELMNFARAGIVSRMLNQAIPYFNASMVGKRKFYGQLLWGGDAQGDAAKARVQRAAFLNGLSLITPVSLAMWLWNKDEDWYQDLPDFRKVNYWNFKIGDTILSLPKPFEPGVFFGTIPEILLDHSKEGAHPAALKEAANTAFFGFLEGIGALIPTLIKPFVEVGTNYDFFRGRPLTPEWIARAMPKDEQMTFYTTATARILSKAIGGVLSPIEIEQFLGGYTAGGSTSALRAIDEITRLKDHPLGFPMPWHRFFAQQPHGQSAYVDDLYKLSVELEQREGADRLGPGEAGLKLRVERAKTAISSLRKQGRAGQITVEEAERRSFEIARPLVRESQR